MTKPTKPNQVVAPEEILRKHLAENNCIWDEGYKNEFHITNAPNTLIEVAMQEYASIVSADKDKALEEKDREIENLKSKANKLYRLLDNSTVMLYLAKCTDSRSSEMEIHYQLVIEAINEYQNDKGGKE